MPSQAVTQCAKVLSDKQWKISFAESASAGRMSYEFSTTPYSGDVLLGGMVSYDAGLKETVLQIPHALIQKYTAESAEVTCEMSHAFHKISASDVCVAITGLTTSGGSESAEKPVGTIFIHIIMPNTEIAKRFEFQGNAEEIVLQAIDQTAMLISSDATNKDSIH